MWPIHLKPLDDELLSSWLVRLATAHGLKAKGFTSAILPGVHIWKNDIDLSGDDRLFKVLIEKTGTEASRVAATTLDSYRGWLFEDRPPSGPIIWVMRRNVLARVKANFGLQFCPMCLAEGIPYFRRTWRLAFVVFCSKHCLQLLDRCPNCGQAINFFRSSISDRYNVATLPDILTLCHRCRFDLRNAHNVINDLKVQPSDVEFQQHLLNVLKLGWAEIPQSGAVYSHLYFAGVYKLASRLIEGRFGKTLQEAIVSHYGIKAPIISPPTKPFIFERLEIGPRRALLTMVKLLLADWPEGFVKFSKVKRIGGRIWLSRKFLDATAPYWYWKVIREHLTSPIYSASDEEALAVIKYLRERNVEITKKQLTKYLSDGTAARVMQEKGFLNKRLGHSRTCPRCGVRTLHIKAGRSRKGAQKYRCLVCSHNHNPTPAHRGYPNQIKLRSMRLRRQGKSYQEIGRILSIPAGTVWEWQRKYGTDT